MVDDKTLRDEFAMAALTGLCYGGRGLSGEMAKQAYKYADAMMKERSQEGRENGKC